MEQYAGGKNVSYREIINLIPPHYTYCELFAGSAAVARHKKPAQRNVINEIDPSVAYQLQQVNWPTRSKGRTEWSINNHSAFDILAEAVWTRHKFVYLDPPYLGETRNSQRPIYAYEMMDPEQHEALLKLIKSSPAMIMISGYWSEMYADHLSEWNTHTFEAQTRGGSTKTEWLWMNYPRPNTLHEYTYLGDNFRDREVIKRRVNRTVNKWAKWPELERKATIEALKKEGLL